MTHTVKALLPAALCLLLLAGCFPQPEPPPRFAPGEPLYEQYTTEGRRLVFAGEEGPILKLRQRRRVIRVYGADLVPVGRLHLIGDEGVEVQGRSGTKRLTPRWVSDDVAELPSAWRIERADGGWDVFTPQGQLVALWRRDADEAWVMYPSYGPRTKPYRVFSENGRQKVLGPDEKARLLVRASFTDLQLLAFALTEIAPLERAALAYWVDGQLP